MMTCPFKHKVEITQLPTGDLRPCISLADDRENVLLEALLTHWRWCAEGNLAYYHSAPAGAEVQHFYDRYHCRVDYDPVAKNYSFNIQVYDSPEGDTWWRGRFTYVPGDGVKVIEESTYAN